MAKAKAKASARDLETDLQSALLEVRGRLVQVRAWVALAQDQAQAQADYSARAQALAEARVLAADLVEGLALAAELSGELEVYQAEAKALAPDLELGPESPAG